MNGSDLIAALSSPEAYAFPVTGEIEVLQTHISMLFFVNDRVFKVKKTVDMGFLDYSTLDRRRHFCEEEVRLNRRLAAQIYIGVSPIVRDADGVIRVSAAGHEEGVREVIDYAVEMRRLPEDRMLDHLLAAQQADERTIDLILDTVIPFHDTCERGPAVAAYGEPSEVHAQMRENLDRLKMFASDDPLGEGDPPRTLSTLQWTHLRQWVERFVTANQSLLAARRDGGFIRELHGDMHAGNICMCEDGITIYDCIEYTPRYRCRDVACEMAYLAMDLDLRGRADLANLLINRYAERTGDPALRDLDTFYRVSMAIVRALVESIRAAESEVEPAERAHSFEAAARYVSLAIGYTLPPTLVIMSGLPGTGKSWFAESLATALRGRWIRSDEVRKELAGLAPTSRDDSIYTDALTRQTYDKMLSRARAAIEQGESVVLDATYSKAEQRTQVQQLADDLGSRAVLLCLDVGDEAVIQRRLTARSREGTDPSDADWNTFKLLRDAFEPPDEWPATESVRVDATSNAATRPEVVRLALDQLVRSGSTTQ